MVVIFPYFTMKSKDHYNLYSIKKQFFKFKKYPTKIKIKNTNQCTGNVKQNPYKCSHNEKIKNF